MLRIVARLLVVIAAFIVALWSWAEWLHWRASGRRLGSPHRPGGREAIVVLGFKNRGAKANYLNRYRVRAALRSVDPEAGETTLVLCGGPVGGATAEADLLRDYAVDRLGFTGPILMDRESTTTWQNIENAIPLIEGFDTIKVVSNSLHAEKARRYLWKQRPDLARKLARAAEYRLGEIALVKPLAAIVALRNPG